MPVLINSLFDDSSGSRKQRLKRAEALVWMTKSSKIMKFTLHQIELGLHSDSELFCVYSVVVALISQLDANARDTFSQA
jgi:hypothetical protein